MKLQLPHWASIVIGLLSVVVAWLVQQNAQGSLVLPAIVLTVLPLVQMILTVLSPSAVATTNANAALKANATKLAGSILFLLCVVLLSGCISSAPTVPVTQANAAQVSSCQSTASTHNAFVIGDFALGGSATGLSTVAAAMQDPTVKTDLAIATAVVGGVLVFGTAMVGLTASNFANSHCSDVVGNLPAIVKPAAVSP